MIYVFKTNVETQTQVDALRDVLDAVFSKAEWNFDLEDCDRIFRIDTVNYNKEDVIEFFNEHSISCLELEE